MSVVILSRTPYIMSQKDDNSVVEIDVDNNKDDKYKDDEEVDDVSKNAILKRKKLQVSVGGTRKQPKCYLETLSSICHY